MELSVFEKSYIETMFWSSIDDDTGEPMDALYSLEDIAPETLDRIIKDCEDFQNDTIYKELTNDFNDVCLGHDFWLTRNRHGAGFWDGDYPKKVGNYLTDRAHSFGEIVLYRGDDGKLYLM